MTLTLRLPLRGIQILLAILLAWIPIVATPDALTELESARHSLAAARKAAITAEAEFRTLLKKGSLTQSDKEDYLTYLSKLEQVVAEKCKAVLTSKAALDDNTPEVGCNLGSATSTEAVSFPDERTEDERVGTLDSELATSMSEFDELLLREMEELKRRQSRAPDASEGAGSAGGGGQQSGDSDDTGDVAATNTGEEATEEDRTEQNQPEQQGQEQTASRQSESGQSLETGGQNNDKTTTSTRRDAPPDDGDDDIVARQLREAAEKETDPELREKLWEEYRRYKADTTAKSN